MRFHRVRAEEAARPAAVGTPAAVEPPRRNADGLTLDDARREFLQRRREDLRRQLQRARFGGWLVTLGWAGFWLLLFKSWTVLNLLGRWIIGVEGAGLLFLIPMVLVTYLGFDLLRSFGAGVRKRRLALQQELTDLDSRIQEVYALDTDPTVSPPRKGELAAGGD